MKTAQRRAKNLTPLTGSNAIPVRSSVFRRIEFPRNLEYKRPADCIPVFKRLEFSQFPKQLRSDAFLTSSSVLGSAPVHQCSTKWAQV
jgi:hypothetical protein